MSVDISSKKNCVCSWLETLIDTRMRPLALDEGLLEGPSLAGNSSQSDVIREGLAVGQGTWPTDR